jgi:hypothetical protein
MIKNKYLFLLVVILIAFSSCKKKSCPAYGDYAFPSEKQHQKMISNYQSGKKVTLPLPPKAKKPVDPTAPKRKFLFFTLPSKN